MNTEQLDLVTWAADRPTAEVVDLVPIIIRNMPDRVIRNIFPVQDHPTAFSERRRGAA